MSAPNLLLLADSYTLVAVKLSMVDSDGEPDPLGEVLERIHRLQRAERELHQLRVSLGRVPS